MAKRRLPPRDKNGRFTKRLLPAIEALIQRVGQSRRRAVAHYLDDTVPWRLIVMRHSKEKG
jgi:hypothetical protein